MVLENRFYRHCGFFRLGRVTGFAAILALGCLGMVQGKAESYSDDKRIVGPIPAQVLNVIDGDTVLVRARIWLDQDIKTKIRLAGVDAPEISGKCAYERNLAIKARNLVRRLLSGGKAVLSDIRYGKYAGRVVARIQDQNGRDVTQSLVDAGLGRIYDGGARASWCDGKEAGESATASGAALR
jgi:micrococcal nuclease